jgi:hypothetical protein
MAGLDVMHMIGKNTGGYQQPTVSSKIRKGAISISKKPTRNKMLDESSKEEMQGVLSGSNLKNE